jgi:hydroxymethylbilane synthase
VKTIILGTRGSRLALAQAELAKQAIERLPEGPEGIVRIITTTGDRRLDINLSHAGGAKIDKGLFTKELEEALLRGEIDVAVHSLKDLPTGLPPDLELAATLPRHDPVDVLISKTANSLREIPPSGVVATGSPRRTRQIAIYRPDLHVADVRGNVTSRIARLLAEDSWDSLVLAKAGLERLGYRLTGGRLQFEGRELFVSDLVELLPAAGQGAIGLEVRANDLDIKQIVTSVSHAETWFCTAVEREFLRLLGGGCQLPLGIRARLYEGCLCCEAVFFDESEKPRSGIVSGTFRTPEEAASALLDKIYETAK